MDIDWIRDSKLISALNMGSDVTNGTAWCLYHFSKAKYFSK